MPEAKYKRVLLKLSGEALRGRQNYGIDNSTLVKIARQIKSVRGMGVDIGIVVGGGNIWRGAKAETEGMVRVTADYAGMLATVINALGTSRYPRKRRHRDPHTISLGMVTGQAAEPFIRTARPAPPGKRPGSNLRRGHRTSLYDG